MKENFTVEQMKAALLAIRDRISNGQLLMLKGHYGCRTASMGTIAGFAGYKNFGAANSQYGKLGRTIAEQLSFVKPDEADWTYTIATVHPELDDKGHEQWTMDDVVATALEELRWVSVAVPRVKA